MGGAVCLIPMCARARVLLLTCLQCVCVCVCDVPARPHDCRALHGRSIADLHMPRRAFTYAANPDWDAKAQGGESTGVTAQEAAAEARPQQLPPLSRTTTGVETAMRLSAAVPPPSFEQFKLSFRANRAQARPLTDGEAAYASLLSELCAHVGVSRLEDLLPRVKQLCSATLLAPALEAFANSVCDRLAEVSLTRAPVTLSQGYDLLLSALRQLRTAIHTRRG